MKTKIKEIKDLLKKGYTLSVLFNDDSTEYYRIRNNRYEVCDRELSKQKSREKWFQLYSQKPKFLSNEFYVCDYQILKVYKKKHNTIKTTIENVSSIITNHFINNDLIKARELTEKTLQFFYNKEIKEGVK